LSSSRVVRLSSGRVVVRMPSSRVRCGAGAGHCQRRETISPFLSKIIDIQLTLLLRLCSTQLRFVRLSIPCVCVIIIIIVNKHNRLLVPLATAHHPRPHLHSLSWGLFRFTRRNDLFLQRIHIYRVRVCPLDHRRQVKPVRRRSRFTCRLVVVKWINLYSVL
jgi:hypothetical protein